MHSDPDPYERLFEGRRGEALRPAGSEWLSRRSTRAKALIALGGVLVLCGIVVFTVWRGCTGNREDGERYQRIEAGMTYDEVVEIMGRNGYVSFGQHRGEWVNEWQTKDGVIEVWLDDDGRVESKGFLGWP